MWVVVVLGQLLLSTLFLILISETKARFIFFILKSVPRFSGNHEELFVGKYLNYIEKQWYRISEKNLQHSYLNNLLIYDYKQGLKAKLLI